jgi:hypothetical protein
MVSAVMAGPATNVQVRRRVERSSLGAAMFEIVIS